MKMLTIVATELREITIFLLAMIFWVAASVLGLYVFAALLAGLCIVTGSNCVDNFSMVLERWPG